MLSFGQGLVGVGGGVGASSLTLRECAEPISNVSCCPLPFTMEGGSVCVSAAPLPLQKTVRRGEERREWT